jgi:hypothetical protein
MYDFQNYYDLRQAGFDPNAQGKTMLRNIRTTLKGYVKRIDSMGGEGMWGTLKSSIQELYYTLSKSHDIKTLAQELDNHINQFSQFQSDHRQQDGIRLSVVRLLNELRNHITDYNTGQAG